MATSRWIGARAHRALEGSVGAPGHVGFPIALHPPQASSPLLPGRPRQPATRGPHTFPRRGAVAQGCAAPRAGFHAPDRLFPEVDTSLGVLAALAGHGGQVRADPAVEQGMERPDTRRPQGAPPRRGADAPGLRPHERCHPERAARPHPPIHGQSVPRATRSVAPGGPALRRGRDRSARRERRCCCEEKAPAAPRGGSQRQGSPREVGRQNGPGVHAESQEGHARRVRSLYVWQVQHLHQGADAVRPRSGEGRGWRLEAVCH
mmetsp:Transcript_7572/g.14816  ORF Transcript_7572/g.14816 Transcript_7572/m.14816 type:complete len:262 (+) Transcript_7572:1802-2587(+)